MSTQQSHASKKSPLPPTTSTVLTPRASYSARTRARNGVMGSRATSAAMRPSRSMKLVALVSSSTSRQLQPASSASAMFAACDVEPLASCVENARVSRPPGRSLMNAEMSTAATCRGAAMRRCRG